MTICYYFLINFSVQKQPTDNLEFPILISVNLIMFLSVYKPA